MSRPELRTRVSVFATIGLALIWMLLWGDLSLGAALWGIAIALLIQVLFPLPDVPELPELPDLDGSLGGSLDGEDPDLGFLPLGRQVRARVNPVPPATLAELLTGGAS